MATSRRFELGLRVLAMLAEDPGRMHTSAEIAETLGSSAVMVRRSFLQLHRGGFIAQRKGPSGGARLKITPKEIGLGDIFAAMSDDWLLFGDKGLDPLLKRAQAEAIEAMNETTLAQVVKRLKKA